MATGGSENIAMTGAAWAAQYPNIISALKVDDVPVTAAMIPTYAGQLWSNKVDDTLIALVDTVFALGAGSGTLAALTDTTITAPASDHVLVYDGVSNWVNILRVLGGNADVNLSGQADGDVLSYNGSSLDWEPLDPRDLAIFARYSVGIAAVVPFTATLDVNEKVDTSSGSFAVTFPAGVDNCRVILTQTGNTSNPINVVLTGGDQIIDPTTGTLGATASLVGAYATATWQFDASLGAVWRLV